MFNDNTQFRCISIKTFKGVKKYVHITHSPGSIGVYKMYSLDFFDVVLLNGNHQIEDIRELEKLRGTKEKDLFVVGSTYLDQLNKKLNEIRISSNIERDAILIAPSWGSNGLLKKFGEKLIDSVLTLNYKVIIRPHPQSSISEKEMINSLKKIYKDNNNIEWDHNTDSSHSFLRSIAMISDFSGVIFDYSFLMEKPVLIPDFEYKKDGFDAYFLKDDIWQLKVLPKISIKFYENNNKPFPPSEFAKFVLNYLEDGKNLVELGCGNGRDSIFFASNKIKVFGIDQVIGEIEFLNKEFQSDNLKFMCLDFTNLYLDYKFDYVYSRFTLHSIDEEAEDRVLTWVLNHLNVDGLFFCRGKKYK